ncbi:hypothetical protein PVAG01_03795 [Phlyctema vagabunda]|uniref:Uncharacterized protein n=1 Tax=Phlyctema vagabunda TaxID=108571 RepID=A0ABR4PMI4_9HELO
MSGEQVTQRELCTELRFGEEDYDRLQTWLRSRHIHDAFEEFQQSWTDLNKRGPDRETILEQCEDELHRSSPKFKNKYKPHEKTRDNWSEEDHYVRFITIVVRFERDHDGLWFDQGIGKIKTLCEITLKVLQFLRSELASGVDLTLPAGDEVTEEESKAAGVNG